MTTDLHRGILSLFSVMKKIEIYRNQNPTKTLPEFLQQINQWLVPLAPSRVDEETIKATAEYIWNAVELPDEPVNVPPRPTTKSNWRKNGVAKPKQKPKKTQPPPTPR